MGDYSLLNKKLKFLKWIFRQRFELQVQLRLFLNLDDFKENKHNINRYDLKKKG